MCNKRLPRAEARKEVRNPQGKRKQQQKQKKYKKSKQA
jgi:hypothetical protein